MKTQLGAYLNELRLSKGMTPQQVRDAAEISEAYLSKLESGAESKPSPRVLHTLSVVYDKPFEEILQAAGYSMEEKCYPDSTALSGVEPMPNHANERLLNANLTPQEAEIALGVVQVLRRQVGNRSSNSSK